MATYSVVFWNNTSAVIPDNWINHKTKLFRWPDSENPVSQIVKALPPNDSFHAFQYQRVVGSFDYIKDEWRSSTGNVIEAVIKSWLQHADDRLRQKNN
ncbi:hypothetical protein PV325_009697 [Microctonus aethiopoides]|uniref:Uncharacterized protein n=1 Tax=Microctonus aethiopoides TaxID=144406 RepID=A0AA39F9W6_9HYME|nr:hypothetical protein PV325_009697 [Microctonus aethiopoides]KAK0075852.1 hypothetical protein PV326_011237 [Microctonus aethiopoides]KAK0165583.1 hypothetical protein PV328_004087 [Microctonus aethiopoides]